VKRDVVYRCWAPDGELWRPWVKPVLFAALDEESVERSLPEPPDWLARLVESLAAQLASSTETSTYRDSTRVCDTAMVVDLPGPDGTLVGAALAAHGCRPVPLYNAVPAPPGVSSVVDVRPIMSVLVAAAQVIGRLPQGLPPAFLLDADRMGQDVPRAGAFDNRSICNASDFPSADTLIRAGIRRVVLVRARPAADLDAIMLEWQRRGIVMWAVNPTEAAAAQPVVLQKPPWHKRLEAWLARGMLSRRSDGSYGLMVPSQGG
jgi:hypothetical protein